MTKTMGLDAGLRVLVTAGASGIGRVIAESFASAGARIHICDNATQMIDECSAAHPDWGFTLCDVSNEADVSQMFNDAKRHLGGLSHTLCGDKMGHHRIGKESGDRAGACGHKS